MAGFSEQTLQKKLAELSNTMPSIQTLSLWLIHHRKHSKTIVEVWLKEVRRERESKKLLTFVYLANDVIQNSRKRWPLFKEQFQNVLTTGLAHVARYVDVKTLQNIRRVLDVWRDRNVYTEDALGRFTYALTSNLTKEMLALFNEGAKTPPRPEQASRSKPATSSTSPVLASTPSTSEPVKAGPVTTYSKPRTYSFGSPLTPPLGVELPLNLMDDEEEAESEKKQEADKKNSDEAEESVDNAATSELMNSLKEFEKAASADVQTREQIAQFPPDVADLSKLKNVKNKDDADRFAVQVAQADTILSEYNARLTEELEKRKTTLAKLERFIAAHKRRIEDETNELSEWKEKLAKVSSDRRELLVHIQSLPDLTKLPDPTKLPPLPSAGDLFMQ